MPDRLVVHEERPEVHVDGDTVRIRTETKKEVVTVFLGIPGPRGLPGPQGEKGDAGGQIPLEPVYFNEASDTWVWNHGWNAYPNVATIDSAGSKVDGTITYPDADTVIVKFFAPMAGKLLPSL